MDRFRQDVTIELSKSIWKERYTRNFRFFCPFCSTPRRLGMHPRPGHPMHFLQVGLTALVFTIATWPVFGIKGLVSFVPLWIAFEVIYRARVRASLRCKGCGFDPLLYLVDVDRAKAAIREHWEEKLARRADQLAAAQLESDPEEVEDSSETPAFEAEVEDPEMTQSV